jgi:hypothetical protein
MDKQAFGQLDQSSPNLKIFTQTLANIEKFLVSQIVNLCVQFRFFLIYHNSYLGNFNTNYVIFQKKLFQRKKYFVKEKNWMFSSILFLEKKKKQKKKFIIYWDVLKSWHGSVVGKTTPLWHKSRVGNTKLWCESTVRNTNCDVNWGVEIPSYVREQAPQRAARDATLRAGIGVELFCNV